MFIFIRKDPLGVAPSASLPELAMDLEIWHQGPDGNGIKVVTIKSVQVPSAGKLNTVITVNQEAVEKGDIINQSSEYGHDLTTRVEPEEVNDG